MIAHLVESTMYTYLAVHDNPQPAYKAGHHCEIVLLRMYNDIVTTVSRGNGAMLVLSANVHTIDHDNLFAGTRLTIQTEHTTSITSPTQTHHILHHSKAKKNKYILHRIIKNECVMCCYYYIMYIVFTHYSPVTE